MMGLYWQAVTRIADGLKTSCGGIVTVAGTRGIGKSSFARLLVNHLLNDFPSVAFLETDLGQPEFTVPGASPNEVVTSRCGIFRLCTLRGLTSMSSRSMLFAILILFTKGSCVLPAGLLSLHFLTDPIFGPPHLHQRRPDFTQFIGDVSPQSEIQQCSAAVHRLYESYRMHCSHQDSGITNQSPLVVNTHGWIQVHFAAVTLVILSLHARDHLMPHLFESSAIRKRFILRWLQIR